MPQPPSHLANPGSKNRPLGPGETERCFDSPSSPMSLEFKRPIQGDRCQRPNVTEIGRDDDRAMASIQMTIQTTKNRVGAVAFAVEKPTEQESIVTL